MIEANHLYKVYKKKQRTGLFHWDKQEKIAIQNVSLKLKKGNIIGVLGENGAGKTTLIKMLTTLLVPTAGTIMMNGQSVYDNIKQTRFKINMITGGERNIYWRLTPKENLQYFGALYRIPHKALNQRIDNLLKQVGLWHERDIPAEQFSKGMKQRLQIAKGLINNPEYIFLDEPTLGLDVSIAKDLRQYVKRLAVAEDKGILLTTHYMQEAEELCDYIYILDKGRILIEGTKEEIFQKSNSKYVICISFSAENEVLLQRSLKRLQVDFTFKNDKLFIELDDSDFMSISAKLKSLPMQIKSFEIAGPKLENVLLNMKGKN